MPQHLPSLPNLDHLKKQAKDVLRVARHRSPLWRLTEAQHAVAHGYGFDSWPALKLHVESVRQRRSAASSAREAESPSAGNTNAMPHTAMKQRPCRSSHPLAGTWAKRPSASSGGRAHAPMDDIVLEFELTDGAVTLTQIVMDSTGRQSATKTVIQADGEDRAAEFGEGLMLRATWTNDRTLELIFKRAETVVSKWAYEVLEDGHSLVVSTTEQAVVFERVE
jgi:hypothetical protein